jgi:hypothetical protein
MILNTVLLISRFEANLLLLRDLYEQGLVGYFGLRNMYFMLNQTTIVTARMVNSLQIVDHISSYFNQIAFRYLDHNINNNNN